MVEAVEEPLPSAAGRQGLDAAAIEFREEGDFLAVEQELRVAPSVACDARRQAKIEPVEVPPPREEHFVPEGGKRVLLERDVPEKGPMDLEVIGEAALLPQKAAFGVAFEQDLGRYPIEGGAIAGFLADRACPGEGVGREEEIDVAGAAELLASVEAPGKLRPLEGDAGNLLGSEDPEQPLALLMLEALREGVSGKELFERFRDRFRSLDPVMPQIAAHHREEAALAGVAENFGPGKNLGIPARCKETLALVPPVAGQEIAEAFPGAERRRLRCRAPGEGEFLERDGWSNRINGLEPLQRQPSKDDTAAAFEPGMRPKLRSFLADSDDEPARNAGEGEEEATRRRLNEAARPGEAAGESLDGPAEGKGREKDRWRNPGEKASEAGER